MLVNLLVPYLEHQIEIKILSILIETYRFLDITENQMKKERMKWLEKCVQKKKFF